MNIMDTKEVLRQWFAISLIKKPSARADKSAEGRNKNCFCSVSIIVSENQQLATELHKIITKKFWKNIFNSQWQLSRKLSCRCAVDKQTQ